MWKKELVRTKDGSLSLYVPELKEAYHSGMGALADTNYIYIDKGLNYFRENISSELKILEMGFCTGLNAFFTLKEAFCDQNLKINYTTLEAYPVPPDLLSQMEYEKLMPVPEVAEHFTTLHVCEWGKEIKILPNFTLKKELIRLEDFTSNENYQLIYYDAFSPNKQPELWTYEILEKLFSLLSSPGVLVTYCAKGQFKRDLRSIGFTVESLPGMPGKKEMIRAHKN